MSYKIFTIFRSYFKLLVPIILFLGKVAYAADQDIMQIDIVNPQHGISHNRIEHYNVAADGIVINNSRHGEITNNLGFVNANKNLNEPAKTILFEVTGAGRSELKGITTILGDQAKLILVNPNGIACDGCRFINAHAVELRTGSGEVSVDRISASPNTDIIISGKKVDVKSIDGARYLIISGQEVANSLQLNNVENIEIVEPNVDFSIVTPTEIKGVFKFTGRDFKVQDIFKAKNVELDLSGDFINDENGNIIVKEQWHSIGNGFANYKKIDVGTVFEVTGTHFINDKGASIASGSIKLNLTGKMADGNGLYQGSNSILESRDGGMKLIAPEGGMYFGYKKEFVETSDNKNEFKFIGSQLLSRNGPIHIQAGGNVIFDGTQVLGDIIAEAKGEIKENNLIGSYPVVRVVNKDEIRERKVFDHVHRWCPSGVTIFGGCVGGPKSEDVYRTESYVEKVSAQETHSQEVALKAGFAGNKQFFANKAAASCNDLDVDYLKFVSSANEYDYDNIVRA